MSTCRMVVSMGFKIWVLTRKYGTGRNFPEEKNKCRDYFPLSNDLVEQVSIKWFYFHIIYLLTLLELNQALSNEKDKNSLNIAPSQSLEQNNSLPELREKII